MFVGFNNDLQWFFGIVEDRQDPLRQGRLRVRVMGIHTAQRSKDETTGIPIEELLWMHPMTPITSAAMSGIGQTPTGPVEGTQVFGFFRDPFCQDGVVIGTIGGCYATKPDTSKGFCDPSGQYPRYIGNDLNILAGGGQKSVGGTGAQTVDDVPLDIYQQENTTSIAVAPNDLDLSKIPTDDNPNYTLEQMLRGDEGYKLTVYWDTLGYPTIGIGHLIIAYKTRDMSVILPALSRQVGRDLTNPTITPEEVSKLFADDILKMRTQMYIHGTIGPVYRKLNGSRRMALENMCFQMGVGGVAKFKNTLSFMAAEDWKNAYNNMVSSLWASQTPGRAKRVSKIILVGNLESYGVMAPKEEPDTGLPDLPDIPGVSTLSAAAEDAVDTATSTTASAVRTVTGSDTTTETQNTTGISAISTFSTTDLSASVDESPEDPFTPEDTRIMFEEPKSSFAAQYPYNHVYESESGHIQEFDDTPGQERYRLKHPTGTYLEVRPDGTRVTKIIGEDYLIIQEGHNVHVQGNLKFVVDGDSNIYFQGNLKQTVDGNVNQNIRGNVTEVIEGNVDQTVKGDVKSLVNGNVTEQVDGNVTSTIKGNVTQSIKGNNQQTINGSNTQKIDGSNTQTVDGSMTTKVSGTYKVEAAEVSIEGHGNALLKAGGTAQVSGATINLN